MSGPSLRKPSRRLTTGGGGGGGDPRLPRAPAAWHRHLHRLRGRASGCARARPELTRREQTSPAGPGGREHPRVGPGMPFPTCHFARSRCRGCGHGSRLETQWVRAPVCALVCVRELLFAVRLTYSSRRHQPPPPRKRRPPTPSRRARARPPPAPARRPPPPGARSSPQPQAGVSAGCASADPWGSARLLRPPAGLGVPQLWAPPRLAAGCSLLPQLLSLPLRSRLPASEPELSPRSPNLPGLRSMPSAARPAGLGVGRGRAGREPAGRGGGARRAGDGLEPEEAARQGGGSAGRRWVGRPGKPPRGALLGGLPGRTPAPGPSAPASAPRLGSGDVQSGAAGSTCRGGRCTLFRREMGSRQWALEQG